MTEPNIHVMSQHVTETSFRLWEEGQRWPIVPLYHKPPKQSNPR